MQPSRFLKAVLRLRLIVWLFLGTLVFSLTPIRANADSAISVTDASIKIDYPNQMLFHLGASGPASISVISLAVRFKLSGTTTRLIPKFTSATQVDTSVSWQLGNQSSSAVGGYLPPGAQGDYSWHLEDTAGNKLDTRYQAFHILDNRRTWQSLKNDQIVLYWYDGDSSFGSQIFDKANQVLGAIQNDMGATLTGQVQIFIYGNRTEFLSALQPGNHEWAGGTVDDTFGIVLINASAGDLDYGLTTTPHELTHLVIAQALKGPFQGIGMPLWMNEGLAVYHEFVPPHDESRFEAALRRGVNSDSLLRLRSLSGNFPTDSNEAEMAYGEGYSTVDFMLKQYGRDKMKQLTALFKAGTTADDAFQQVFGVDQDGFENLWRKSIGAAQKNYPKAPTPTPGGVPTMSLSTVDTPGAPTATPASVAIAVTPEATPAAAPTSKPAGAGAGGICGGLFGGVALVGFGMWQIKRRKIIG